MSWALAAAPDPETIRRTANEVLARAEFQIDPVPESDFTLTVLLFRFLLWLLTPFRWLLKVLEGTMPDPLRWALVVGLGIVLLALIIHIGYTLVTAVRGRRRVAIGEIDDPRDVRDPGVLETQAQTAADREDFIAAVRLLFRACLLRLEQSEQRALRAGVTNREVLRRHRDSPVFESMKLFVDVIETKWYGRGTCGPEDYEACRAAHLNILRLAKGPVHADSA